MLRGASDQVGYPRRPIKLVVPFAAGGGSDTFGRIIQNAIEQHDLLPQPVVIINVPGAGGTIGSRRVKNARPDGYTLLLLHEGILTAKHSGNSAFGPEAFTPIAGTGDSIQVIAVGPDSSHQDLSSLMNDAARDPDTIVFSANIGAPSHFAGLMLEAEKPGATFRYTQTGGGAKRFAALQGGHVDVSAFSIAEYVQFKSSGMRALALLGPQRHPELPGLATAREQGFDVISQNMQFWWAPTGTSPDRVDRVADAIEAAMQTREVRERLAEMKISTVTLRGDALRDEIELRNERIASVAPGANVELPNFPLYVFAALVLIGCIVLGQMLRGANGSAVDRQATDAEEDLGDKDADKEEDSRRSIEAIGSPDRLHIRGAILVGMITIAYVVILQLQWVRFVPATAAYTLLCGGILAGPELKQRQIRWGTTAASLLVVGVLMSFGMHYLFTKVLVVDLP